MDYCLEVTKAHVLFNKEWNSILFERMENESEFILSCMENYHVVMEEAQQTSSQGKTMGLWDKIKTFFANIFNLFKEKTQGLYTANKQWMDNNFSVLDKIDYTNLKISMLPHWDVSTEKMRADANQMFSDLRAISKDPKRAADFKTLDQIKQGPMKQLVDENNDLTNGIKNTFRVGHSKGPLKPVELKGADLASKVKIFKDYCYSYSKDVEPLVQGLMTQAEREVKVLEDMIKKAPPTSAKEGFCLIENAYYGESSLVVCDNFNILTEADQPANNNENNNQQQPANNNNNQNKGTKPTQVEVTNMNDKSQAAKDEVKQHYAGMDGDQLSMAKNVMQEYQVVVSALMTVAEEKFKAYLNALKALVTAGGKGIENNPNDKEGTGTPIIKDNRTKVQKVVDNAKNGAKKVKDKVTK